MRGGIYSVPYSPARTDIPCARVFAATQEVARLAAGFRQAWRLEPGDRFP